MLKKFLGALGLAVCAVTALAQSPGPRWAQYPPIGVFASEVDYVDANGALVAVGGRTVEQRIWRHAGSWQEVYASPGAPHPSSASYAYDSARGVLVQFGGFNGAGPVDEQWEFDGSAWTRRTPATLPPPRYDGAMAYDPVRNRVVLHGGTVGGAFPSDTWVFDGVDWKQIVTSTLPNLVTGSRMTFDDNLQRPLLVGPSLNPGSNVCETWQFDGVDWTQIATTTSPQARVRFRMAHDPVRGVTIVHGGTGFVTGPSPVETWQFNGTDWSMWQTNYPPGFMGQDLEFWPAVGGVVCVGGTTGSVAGTGAICRFDGLVWQPLTPDIPFFRRQAHLAYDTVRNCIVLLGGRDQSGNLQSSTFEWHKATGWQLRNLGSSPIGDLVFDPVRRLMLSVYLGTTWSYQNGNWTALPVAVTPPDGPMSFDRHRQRIVLHSGANVWSFDGQQWQQDPPTTGPAAPVGANVTSTFFSAEDGILARFLGSTTLNYLHAGVWATVVAPYMAANLNGQTEDPLRGGLVMLDLNQTWFLRRLVPFPQWYPYPYRNTEDVWNCSLVTDYRTGQVYGVSSTGEVWRMDYIETPGLTPFGTGCPGSNGTPRLESPTPYPMPALGQVEPLILSGLPVAAGSFVLASGDSIDQAFGAPLPIPLDPIGLLGCRAWIGWNTAILLGHPGSSVTFQLAVPNTPTLAGVTLGLQALVLDPAATNWGSVSNAALLTAY